MHKEIEFIKNLTKSYPRSHTQLNSVFNADAEIIRLPDGRYLVCTVDTVVEEIFYKALSCPETLAWLTAVASLSDMVAVGVKPQALDITISSQKLIKQLSSWQNIFAELKGEHHLEKLDIKTTDGKEEWALAAAHATTSERPKLNRLGLKPGDHIYLTGPLGWGNAVAFANVALRNKISAMADELDRNYRPKAQTAWLDILNQYATASIDTSDGGLNTLDLMMLLNDVGFEIHYQREIFHPEALKVAHIAGVSPWLFFAAQNGEFQIMFSVSPANTDSFLKSCQNKNLNPLFLGRVIEKGLKFILSTHIQEIHLGEIRNLFYDGIEPASYITRLMDFGRKNRLDV